jgi:hypothetical protein
MPALGSCWTTIGRFPTRMLIARRADLTGTEQTRRVPASLAVARLDHWLSDPSARRVLLTVTRETFREEMGATPQQLRARLEAAFRDGSLLASWDEPIRTVSTFETLTALGPESIRGEEEKAWVAFQVVDDERGRTIPKVKLTITLPDGSRGDHETNDDGIVEVRDLERGSCTITADIANLTLGNTLSLVGSGGHAAENNEIREKVSLTRLANVRPHRVRSGESLAKLASRYGLSWQALAQFNFGTTEPEKLKRLLRIQVGCRKTTADGNSYVFDDEDKPGILYVPEELRLSGLSTGTTHVLRVAPLARPRPRFLFSY